jgi:DNA-binding PadR family transcriptional regulator
MTRRAGQEPEVLLPLKPDVFLILTILAGEDQYGYGIMQAAEEWSGGRVELQAGALYRRLKWMLEEDLIQEMGERRTPGQERRRYYRITAFGRRVAHAESRRMAELIAAASRVDLVSRAEGA